MECVLCIALAIHGPSDRSWQGIKLLNPAGRRPTGEVLITSDVVHEGEVGKIADLYQRSPRVLPVCMMSSRLSRDSCECSQSGFASVS